MTRKELQEALEKFPENTPIYVKSCYFSIELESDEKGEYIDLWPTDAQGNLTS